MLYNIKQAGGLKASRMHEKLGLGWPCLVYLTTSKAQVKQLNNQPVSH